MGIPKRARLLNALKLPCRALDVAKIPTFATPSGRMRPSRSYFLAQRSGAGFSPHAPEELCNINDSITMRQIKNFLLSGVN